jgi:transcriptional regulator with XRE-family HTH domain
MTERPRRPPIDLDAHFRPRPKRKPGAEHVAGLLRGIRDMMGWKQPEMAARLGVDPKTLGNWENAYWLPPAKLRLHVLASLHEVPREALCMLAAALGVPAPPAARAGAPGEPMPTDEELRALGDALVREAAEHLDVRPKQLRAVLAKILAAFVGEGVTLEDAARAIASAEKSP